MRRIAVSALCRLPANDDMSVCADMSTLQFSPVSLSDKGQTRRKTGAQNLRSLKDEIAGLLTTHTVATPDLSQQEPAMEV